MVLLIAINALPLLLLGLAWWQYREEAPLLSRGRRKLFVVSLVVIGMSAALLLVFLVHGRLIVSGAVGSTDVARMYPVLLMLTAGLAGAVLAGFGRRVSRVLLVLSGLLLAVLWYFAGMAASP
jgi:hypothetical protein